MPPVTVCATTLVSEAECLDLLQTWLDSYQNPAENFLLYTVVLKTAQAEWHRLRVQREYDFHLYGHGSPLPPGSPHEIKNNDLILLHFLTAAERRFQHEYRLLSTIGKHTVRPNPNPKRPPTNPKPKCPKSSSSTTKPVNQLAATAITTRPRPATNPNPSFLAFIPLTTPPAPSRGHGRNPVGDHKATRYIHPKYIVYSQGSLNDTA